MLEKVDFSENNDISNNEEYYKVKSLVFSFKYFFIQLNDICDLASVLAVIFILKYSKIAFFADLTDEAFFTYASLSAAETGLELLYTVVTPPIIRMFT